MGISLEDMVNVISCRPVGGALSFQRNNRDQSLSVRDLFFPLISCREFSGDDSVSDSNNCHLPNCSQNSSSFRSILFPKHTPSLGAQLFHEIE